MIYFAGWAKHYSLYPCGPEFVSAFKTQLARYERSKGTIRFPLDEAVPVKLIASIAKYRAEGGCGAGQRHEEQNLRWMSIP